MPHTIPFVSRIILTMLLLPLSALPALGHTPQTNELRALPPNQTLEREMTGVETHRYKFDLKADEFFQVRVEQKGVDVALKLLDAGGKTLATMDSPNGKEGPETLSFVVEKAGNFILEVSGLDAKAKKGIYIINREASRGATTNDKRRVEVERLFVEGLTARNTKGQRELAVNKLKEALVGWEELGDNFLKDLTAQQIKQLAQVPPEIKATLEGLMKELRTAQAFLGEGQELMTKSKADSLPARDKLNQALELFRSVNAKLRGENLLDKVSQSGDTATQSLNYLKAFQYFSKTGEATTLSGIAFTYSNFGEWQENVNYLKNAIGVWQAIITDKTFSNISGIDAKGQILALRHQEAMSLGEIGGTIESRLGQPEEGIRYLNQSLERLRALYQETQNPQIKYQEALTLVRIGLTYGREIQNTKRGTDSLLLANKIFLTLPNRKKEIATNLSIIGDYYSRDFNYEAALKNWNDALNIYQELDDKRGQVSVLRSIGQMYSRLDEKRKVRENGNKSLSILQSPDFADNHRKLYFPSQVKFTVFNELNDTFIEGNRQYSIGLVYELLEDYEKAIEYYEKSLALSRVRKESRDIRGDLWAIGFAYTKLEKWVKALEYFKQALEISRKENVRNELALDLADVGWVLMEAGMLQEALKYQNEALTLCQSVGINGKNIFVPRYSSLLNEIARSQDALGNRRLAIFYGKQAVNVIQNERQRLTNFDAEQQKGFLRKKEKHYRRLADWLIAEGRFAQAEQVLRMLKEEEYSSFVRRDANEIKTLDQRIELKGEEKKLIEKYNLLADRVSEIGKNFFALDEKREKLAERNLKLSAEEEKLHKQHSEELATANAAFKLFLDKELVAELGKGNTEGIDVDRNRQEKLRTMGAGTVLLYTVVGEDRYRVILTTPTVQVDGKYEIKAAELNKKVFAFRDALQNHKIDPRPLGKELYDILIKPIEKDLQTAGAKTLVWSLDGTLRYIPLAALSPDGKSYLVEKYQNVIITPKTSDDISTQSANGQVLGLGVSQAKTIADPIDPEKKLEFPELPGTKTELSAIVKEEKSRNEKGVLIGKRFLDENFTAQNFTESLQEKDKGKRKYTVIHIASHFHLGSNWFNSFLLLGDGRILTLAEISSSPNIKFGDVELITLSACNTAFADEDNGKQVDSLAEVIQTKSGKAVLATLWAVADESTSLLMSEFYRRRKANPKLTKAEAMQLAQKAMIEGKLQPLTAEGEQRGLAIAAVTNSAYDPKKPYAHPYYWSPFILIGNWR